MGGAFQSSLAAAAVGVAGVPEYDDGATMDNAVGVGDIVALVGSTTGERVALLECMTVGPVTYRLHGPLNLYQATGDEFTGVIDFEALGTGTLPTWASSTPGSATVGGPRLAGTGTVKITGLVPMDAKMAPFIKAAGYLVTLSGGTTNDCLLAGFVSDADDTLVQCGGLMKTGSGHANGAGGDQPVNAPIPTANTNYAAQPDVAERWDVSLLVHRYVSGGVQLYGAANNAGQYTTRAGITDTINAQATVTDFQPALSIVGTWAYHVNIIELSGGI